VDEDRQVIERGHRPVSRGLLAVSLAATVAIATLVAGACSDQTRSSAVETPTASARVVSTSPIASPAVTPTTAQAIVDAARRAYGAPGALAVVKQGGERTFLASGAADTGGTLISEGTRFRIASITKPVVAALVLDAVARDEVDLDDVIGELLPGVLRPEPAVSVRQLLNHTSGIFDESNGIDTQEALAADIARLADPELRAEATTVSQQALAGERVIASDRLLVALSETHDRLFEPGSRFSYSNTNYQLAAMVLERVTGMSLGDLLQARIVGPMGLQRMSMAPPDIASPEFRGYGKSSTDGSLVDLTDDLSWFGNGGNGGIISTADDLLIVMQAVVGGTYLPEDLTKAMLTPNQTSYGLGIGGYSLSCGQFFGHQGAVNGTASIAMASQDGQSGAVVAFNLRAGKDPDVVGLADDLLCPGR
jgi:D-alanyl-D-alanine carboxypeptidase